MDAELLILLKYLRKILNNQAIHWSACKRHSSHMDWLSKFAQVEVFHAIERLNTYLDKEETNGDPKHPSEKVT